jgi:DNA-directed RNA polymerase subunit E'/Rpb7
MTTRPVRMSLFKPVYLDQRVAVSPSEFRDISGGDINEFILKKLRKSLEGQCCTHGYVRPGSTQILARSMGQAENGRFTGDFLYYCKVKVACLLPYANQIVEARILKINKLGAYAIIVDGGRTIEAMRILIPRDLHLGNAEFDELQGGQGIRVRILRSRFQANDAFIQAVGMYEGLAPTADMKKGEDAVALEPAVPPTEGDAESEGEEAAEAAEAEAAAEALVGEEEEEEATE